MLNRISLFIILLAVTAAIYGLEKVGAFQPLERLALESRMASDSRRASGATVLVVIDQRSIRQLNSWPWPREVHAKLLDALIELGATEVFFDIDFSTPSEPKSDDQFANALTRAGGRAILPAFKQSSGVGQRAQAVSETFPIALFREHAWLATVNVKPGPDGRVWSYPWGQVIDGAYTESAGAVIAGKFGQSGTDFLVNYAIDPASVPIYSVIDILEGTVHRSEIEGRSIVVGADAAELRDNISVPVLGVISGALLHVLAIETLIMNVIPTPLRVETPFLALATLSIVLALSSLGRKPFLMAGMFSVVSLTVEVVAFVLQKYSAAVLSTPALHITLIGITLTILIRELDLRRWMAHGFRVDAKNTRNVLKHVVSASSDAILVVEETGNVLEMNGRAHALFSCKSNIHQLPRYSDILPSGLSDGIHDAMASLRQGHTMPRKTVSLYHHQEKALYLECSVTPSYLQYRGRNFDLEQPDIIAFIMIQDVTSAHIQQIQLNHLVHHDALTHALNRNGFLRTLDQVLLDENCAVLIINIHRFKVINSTLGRNIGDCVLRDVVDRLGSSAPDSSGIARMGGDTFAVACPIVDGRSARKFADAFLDALEEPFEVEGVKVHIRARIGIALGKMGDKGAVAVEQAEIALDVARESGRRNPCPFELSMVAGQERSRRLERALWEAIANNEFYLAYQPQLDLRSFRIIGAEALIRWEHPEMGSVGPAEFIAIAENSGFINVLGPWVLKRACKDAASWPSFIPLSVNVSPRQFESGSLEDEVRSALYESGLPSDRLCLEITESSLVDEALRVGEVLTAIREMGVRLALDDFGTGFSSLSYLATLPIDKVKLDQVFVRGLSDDSRTDAIIASVVTLCSEMGLELLCEGVETIAQKERLMELGCEQMQGFHFGKPMVLPDLHRWIRAHGDRETSGKNVDLSRDCDGPDQAQSISSRSRLVVV